MSNVGDKEFAPFVFLHTNFYGFDGTNFQTLFYHTFFLLQLNPTYMKRILHFKNITFKSSYNWFKIDIHQQLRPLTANYLAMFKVTSTTMYT